MSRTNDPGHQIARVAIAKVHSDREDPSEDLVAVEEPLEIRLVYTVEGQPVQKSLCITMRTPGHDLELVTGFLLTEGLIRHRREIAAIAPCGPVTSDHGQQNIVKVELAPEVTVDLKRIERHFYTTSSCGVCGKTSLEALMVSVGEPLGAEGAPFDTELIHRLPVLARTSQGVFDQTGGLHAAALVDRAGTLLGLREDVGRHNALDKLIGWRLFDDRLPLSDSIVFVSGRTSFELVQKVVVAGAPVMAAVGAPSSLAIALARQFNLTLIGFVREGRFNIYSGQGRIRTQALQS